MNLDGDKSGSVNPEILKMIEEKRRKALEIRKRKLEEQNKSPTSSLSQYQNQNQQQKQKSSSNLLNAPVSPKVSKYVNPKSAADHFNEYCPSKNFTSPQKSSSNLLNAPVSPKVTYYANPKSASDHINEYYPLRNFTSPQKSSSNLLNAPVSPKVTYYANPKSAADHINEYYPLRNFTSPQKSSSNSNSLNVPVSSNVTKYANPKSAADHINEYYPRQNFTSPQKNSYTMIKDSITSKSPNKSQSLYDIGKPVKILISLESGNRVQFDCPYQSDIVGIFQSIESRNWSPGTKKWSFALSDYKNIVERLKELKERKNVEIIFEKTVPESHFEILTRFQQKNQIRVDLTERFDKEFIDTLYPYQRQGIIFGIQRDGKCLIADDMGLGKSIQAIGLARWYRNDWPLIIICPSSLRYQWKEFILRWIPNVSKEQIFIAVNTKDILPKVDVTITSYDLLTRLKERFSVNTNRFYKMIIMDESHYIKSDTSQRTSVAMTIAQSCQRVVLLSGTPALSRPIELFPQLYVLNKELFPSKHEFGLRYCDAKQKSFYLQGRPKTVWNYNGAKNLDELKVILEGTIMIRRMKKDVLHELPTKRREMVQIGIDYLPEKQRNQLKVFRSKIRAVHSKEESNSMATVWFSKSAEAKIQGVNNYLKDLIEKNVKFICFCHHQSMMDGIDDMLNENQISHIRIDGSTPSKTRQEACEIFQKKESFKVALLSITACATGLNLTAASMVIFAETYWNPGVLAQAEDRAHRIGQSKNVRVIYLLARDTIDEMIWPLISKKLDILNKAGLSRDTFSSVHNPLKVDSSQSVMTEFIQSLRSSDLSSLTSSSSSTTTTTTTTTTNTTNTNTAADFDFDTNSSAEPEIEFDEDLNDLIDKYEICESYNQYEY